MKEKMFAGFWLRVWMWFIDVVVYSLFSIIISVVIGLVSNLDTNSDLNYFISFIINFVIPVIITFLLWKYKGGSIGKITRKVKIVDIQTGNAPTDKQLILRMLGSFLSAFTFFLSYLNVGIDSRKQSWHDKLSGTCVVKNSKLDDYKLTQSTLPKQRDKVFTIIGVSIVSLLLIGCTVIGYMALHDEELLPGAEEWMNPEKFVEKNPRDNGFYFLLGFGCEPDEDPHQIGYEWVQRNNEQIRKNKLTPSLMSGSTIKATLPSYHRKIRFRLPVLDNDITIDSVLVHSSLIDSAYKSMDYLVERYEMIGSHEYNRNTITPDTFSASSIYPDLLSLNKLQNYWILKEYYSGNLLELDLLLKMIEKNKYLVENSNTLIEYLAFNIMQNQNLYTLSRVMDLDSSLDYDSIYLHLNPGGRTNWEIIWRDNHLSSLSSVIDTHNYMLSMYKSEFIIESFLNKYLGIFKFKINRIINSSFSVYLHLCKLSNLSGKGFEIASDYKNEYEMTRFSWFINQVGEAFNAFAVPIYASYITKEHHQHGLISILKLKAMILNEGIDSNDIPEFLEKQVDTLYNPFTERAISWDAENSLLYFNRADQEDEYRVELKVSLEK